MNDERGQVTIAREWDAWAGALPVATWHVALTPGRRVLLAELEDTRLRVSALKEAMDPAMSGRLITRRWVVKDVIAHLASWARQARAELEVLSRGGSFDYAIRFEPGVGPTAWNDEQVGMRGSWPASAHFDEFDRETDAMADLVAGLDDEGLQQEVDLPRLVGEPPRPWRMSLAAMVLAKCWHDRYHLRGLEAGIGGQL